MISSALRRLSRRSPAAAIALTGVILVGGTALLLVITIRDLSRGILMRPIGVLAVLILASLWLARTGLRRRT